MKTLTLDDINRCVVKADYYVFPDTTVTVAALHLQHGFVVVGKSACIDPDNFDAAIGRSLAYQDAIDKIWELEAYLSMFKTAKGLDPLDALALVENPPADLPPPAITDATAPSAPTPVPVPIPDETAPAQDAPADGSVAPASTPPADTSAAAPAAVPAAGVTPDVPAPTDVPVAAPVDAAPAAVPAADTPSDAMPDVPADAPDVPADATASVTPDVPVAAAPDPAVPTPAPASPDAPAADPAPAAPTAPAADASAPSAPSAPSAEVPSGVPFSATADAIRAAEEKVVDDVAALDKLIHPPAQ